MNSNQAKPIKLVLADVDGTLVTTRNRVTELTKIAVEQLLAAGIAFTITSGRPSAGLRALASDLPLLTPFSALNGGLYLSPAFTIIDKHLIDPAVAKWITSSIRALGLDVWIYRENEWYVPSRKSACVASEESVVDCTAIAIPDYTTIVDNVVKIVGVSMNSGVVTKCEATLRSQISNGILIGTSPVRLSIARSHSSYIDFTHPEANKGAVVLALARRLNIQPQEIATIGDMPNDVPMFRQSGISIAMGHADDEVRRSATFVTASNEEDGFAHAVNRIILSRADDAVRTNHSG